MIKFQILNTTYNKKVHTSFLIMDKDKETKKLKPISFISESRNLTPKMINESVENIAHNILYN